MLGSLRVGRGRGGGGDGGGLSQLLLAGGSCTCPGAEFLHQEVTAMRFPLECIISNTGAEGPHFAREDSGPKLLSREA